MFKWLLSEQQTKFIHDRITNVEKSFGEMCSSFALYSRKAARLRDTGDDIARILFAYAEGEDVNKTLSRGLENFGTALSDIGDYGDLRVQTLEKKVVQELSSYEAICKNSKDEIKHIGTFRTKEFDRKRQLDRLRERNPRNRQQISVAETELMKASAEVSRSSQAIEEQTNDFERNKIVNLKRIMLDFVTTELAYHAKALEILSKAYRHIDMINENTDVETYKKAVRLPDGSSNPGHKMLFRPQSMGSIHSTLSNKPPAGIPQPTNNKTYSKSTETLDSLKTGFAVSLDTESETDNSNTISDIKTGFPQRKYQK